MTQFTMPASLFRQMLVGTLVAAAKEDHIEVLHAVYLEVENNTLTTVATDRYRLAVAEARVFEPGSKPGGILMKYDDVVTLLKTIPTRPKPSDTIEVRVVNGLVFKVSMAQPMDSPVWECSFTALKADFPKWRPLIPTAPVATETINFDPAFLADVAKIPHDKKTPVRWTFHGSNRPAMGEWTLAEEIKWTYLLMPVMLPK